MATQYERKKVRMAADPDYAAKCREQSRLASERYHERQKTKLEQDTVLREEFLKVSGARVKKHYARPENKLVKVKRAAEKRGKPWELADEDAIALFKQACHYCKRIGCDNGGLVGIDRKDNTKGYIPGNVLPSCAQCNHAKKNRSYDTMMEWLTAVVNNRQDLSKSNVA